MDLPLLIRKLEEKSRYAELAWQDSHYESGALELLDLHLVLKEAAKRLGYMNACLEFLDDAADSRD